MRAARILETALYVRDMAQAVAFYEEAMGLEPVGARSGRNAFFRCGDGILLLFNAEETLKPPGNPKLPVPPHGARGAGHVCFAAEGAEIDAWAARLKARGVAIEADFLWPNGARSIYFRDPSGNSLEIAEPRLWE